MLELYKEGGKFYHASCLDENEKNSMTRLSRDEVDGLTDEECTSCECPLILDFDEDDDDPFEVDEE